MIPNPILSVLQDLLQDTLQALKKGHEVDIVRTLTALHREVKEGIPGLPLAPASAPLLTKVIGCLEQAISNPSPPTDLPAELQSYPALVDLYATLLELRNFFLALVAGDLSRELRLKGYMAGVFKSFQANLRHLTWQTQMIASGDFSQRVDFMGEFATAFNSMVIRLDESQRQLKEKEAELTRINLDLRQEVELRKKTEKSLRHSKKLYRQLAITDPLTGIFNRRHFFNLAKLELQRTCRYGHPLGVIMMDIDNFKRVNDCCGHAIGDQVLQNVAGSVRQCLRAGDIFARYGGEEFILLVPETDLQAVTALAERLRRQIAGTPLAINQSRLEITISAGVTVFVPSVQSPPIPRTLDALINLADKALYEAKEGGRNRVVVSNGRAEYCTCNSLTENITRLGS
jgi:diguanylate cyclase (GGDEF)-like protein